MTKHYEVIVIGAGSMGMAAGAYLSKQGRKVLLIDAFDPPHSFGSHHGDTRIIRHAYGESKEYVPLALRSQALWSELEAESGMSLFAKTGVINVGYAGSAWVEEVVTSAKEFSLPLEVLNSQEINRHWQGMNIPDGMVGCYETNSGVLFSEQCIRAFRMVCQQSGADLLTNTVVEDIKCHAQGAYVQTKTDTFSADKVIVSAGAWAGKILSELDLPLRPTRKTVGWFEASETLYSPSHYPAFVFNFGAESYYGFPNFHGNGVKVGRHDGGQPIDPDHFNREFGTYPEDEADIRNFLQTYMPQAAGNLKQGKVCIYTYTPDEDFIIDRHPEHPHMVIAAGFSGHGFKFSSVIGEILGQLATQGKTAHNIGKFSLKRFG